MSHNISNPRKRKADDGDGAPDEQLTSSPSESPRPFTRSLPAHTRPGNKRVRSGLVGRRLALPRLLETLDAQQLRDVLASMCARHPQLTTEVEDTAPHPSVQSALAVLKKYEQDLQSAFPFGGDPSSDYAFNRVRQHFLALLEALADFTPHFLPPNETQSTQSLQFLDGATTIIHELPEWSSYQNQMHKQNAYEEMTAAWVMTVSESAKRAGGMQLVYGGWDQKIREHDQRSGGRLQAAVDELSRTGFAGTQSQAPSDNLAAIAQEMLSWAYGSGFPVRVGPW